MGVDEIDSLQGFYCSGYLHNFAHGPGYKPFVLTVVFLDKDTVKL